MRCLIFDEPLFGRNVLLHESFLDVRKLFSNNKNAEIISHTDVFFQNGSFDKLVAPKLKYICYGVPDTFVLFNIWHDHKQMSLDFGLKDIHSAGFCNATSAGLICFGKSIGLDILSRDEDTDIVNELFAPIPPV